MTGMATPFGSMTPSISIFSEGAITSKNVGVGRSSSSGLSSAARTCGAGSRDGERPDSMKRRFREESAWELFRVARSPLRPGFQPPENLLTRHRVWADREGNRAINIQAGMSCPLRLWYFEHLNQVSAFDFSPPAFYPRRVVRSPTSATTIEALRRLTGRADRPTGDPGRPAGSESRRGDSMATATDGLQNALHITARVQSGNKIEMVLPFLSARPVE